MTAGAMTVISGVVLLLVFAIVGWSVLRRRENGRPNNGGTDEH